MGMHPSFSYKGAHEIHLTKQKFVYIVCVDIPLFLQ